MSFSQYGPYNPPAYYQQMENDPTQVPVQTYPYGAGWYGGPGGYGPGGYGPAVMWGPYPGFMLGQRGLTQSDAERIAKEKQDYMERRAEVTENPEHKYINAEGRLAPPVAAAYRAAEIEARRREQEASPFAQLKKKLMASALIGSVVNTLLK